MPELRTAADSVIYAYGQRTGRVIVDVDGDFNESKYPPGPLNPGIIRFNSRRDDDAALFAMFKKFWQSGLRKHAKNSITYLTAGRVRINRAGAEPLISSL
jgi:hypothetical protein